MQSQPDLDPAYFLYHSIGQYPEKAADCARAMAEFAQHWGAFDGAQWEYVLPVRQNFIDRWRAIINADPGTLTACENVTSALSTLVASLPASALKGKRLLVAGDCFPSLHFLLSGLAARFGFTLETVPLRQGETWVQDEDVMAQWGPDVGLALLTWVSSTSSHRCDLEPLVAHGRQMGSIIGVDITQAAGLLPFDVSNPRVDFALSTSLKWMCGTPGAGILYCARPLLQSCEPELRGWFSQEDVFSWDLDKFAFAPDIRRFDNGTPSCVSCVASLPALEWHARQDKVEMLAHNRRLTARLIEGFDEIGLSLSTPRPQSQRGGSIMARPGPGIAAADLVEALERDAIFADARGQTLRFSPGSITTADGVERVIAALRAAIG